MRSALAALLGLVGAGFFVFKIHGDAKAAAYIPPAALLVAAAAAQIPWLGAQLLARGLWWSNLVLGALLVFFGGGSESSLGAGLAAACGAALVMADRRELSAAAETAGFRPAAYAGTLQLLLVLALADAQTLGLFAVIEARHQGATAAVFALVALGLLAGFAGLIRLALWGVGLTMASAAALLAVMVTRAVRVDHDLRVPLGGLAVLQLAAPLPMLVSMALKKKLPEAPLRVRGMLANGVIVAVVLVTLAAWVLRIKLR
ncbi:MAG: hypothetical protein R3A52_31335 [Polyangiales bacterium]